MNPIYYVVINFVIGSFALNLNLMDRTIFLWFILFGVLPELDYVIKFVARGEYNPGEWVVFYKKRADFDGFNLFHSIEFNGVLFLLSFKFMLLRYLLMSSIIHLFVDMIENYLRQRNFRWMKWWSIVWWVKNR